MRLVHVSLLACLALPAVGGCAKQLPVSAPIQTDAALGKVVIYRNGVAYFERRAQVSGRELQLTVPAGKVDDFLKSLTIVEAKTGKNVPVAYPNVEESGEDVTMTVRLPHEGPHDLRITYVTESPAWKPSYRIKLDDAGSAQLEAWAVVDNISGEDWKRVTIGVGSTSALSFRYDLGSIRLVERETLSDGAALALAPPTGGSPYAVAKRELQVIGKLGHSEIDDNVGRDRKPQADSSGRKQGYKTREKAAANRWNHADGRGVGQAGLDNYARIAQRAQRSNNRVRVEGFARPGEKNPRAASLKRAQMARQRLIDNGLAPDQVEAVGTARYSSGEGARIVAVAKAPPPPQSAVTPEAKESPEAPIGSSYFVTDKPMTIEKDHSAMVALLNTSTKAKPVYYFDPVSPRGSKRFAFKAIKLENPTEYTLDRGPFTVYAKGQFLGEGLSEPIPPQSSAFIPYAMDRQVVVETKHEQREEIDKLIALERGILRTETQRIRTTRLSLHNKGTQTATVYVRHAVPRGWKLRAKASRYTKLSGAYLFPVKVPAQGAITLDIEEETPFEKTLTLTSNQGVKAVSLYLKKHEKLDPRLRAELAQILKLQRRIGNLSQKIGTLRQQMNDYRRRVDEIHVQLVTLRKVPHAQRLSRKLAKKMEEISDKLQDSTLKLTDLEGQQMTQQIELQDKLAELTLEPKTDAEKTEVAKSTP